MKRSILSLVSLMFLFPIALAQETAESGMPTIEVDAGQLCNVLLIKPLNLPAMWQ